MSRRNKRKYSVPVQAHSLPSDSAGGGVKEKTRAPLLPHVAFKPLFEKALAAAKSALHATGRITPTALFVYARGLPDEELKEGAAKIVLISWKNEFHKEAMRIRLHEKAEQEGASAVVLLMPTEAARTREGTFLISGAMPDMAADASVTYTFDKEAKTFSFSEMAWRDDPARKFFFEGLFTAPATRETG